LFLLDTNVISELRRNKPHGAVLAWLHSVESSQLYIPAVVIGELQTGIEKLRLTDPDRYSLLDHWVDRIVSTHTVLDADVTVYRRWALIMYGKSPHLYEDALIAATAIIHGLTVVTRNVRDFRLFDVTIFDPFAAID
jgi:predicted nucleic acid-binding protein